MAHFRERALLAYVFVLPADVYAICPRPCVGRDVGTGGGGAQGCPPVIYRWPIPACGASFFLELTRCERRFDTRRRAISAHDRCTGVALRNLFLTTIFTSIAAAICFLNLPSVRVFLLFVWKEKERKKSKNNN